MSCSIGLDIGGTKCALCAGEVTAKDIFGYVRGQSAFAVASMG